MTAIDTSHRRNLILDALCCAIIAIVVLLVFGRLLNAGFTNWDDAHTVVENKDFKPPTFASFISLWTGPRAHLYVPVTYSTWWALAKAVPLLRPLNRPMPRFPRFLRPRSQLRQRIGNRT